MGTRFSTVITGAMHFVDDVRWQEQLQTDPAQFFRAKSAFVIAAVPRFTCPPNIQSYLTYSMPLSDSDVYIAEEAQESGFVVPTGKTEFELCSVALENQEPNGSVYLSPVACEYDSETGDVTVLTDVAKGSSLVLDFYTDGVFDNDLDDTQQRILSLAMAVDWYFQFANAYLGVANLVTDKSFTLKSPSEHIKANTERLRYLQEQLRSELHAYEQRLYKLQFTPKSFLPKV